MRVATQPVEIRIANDEDLAACLALDDSYTTTHTWQVEAVRGEPGTVPYQLNSSVTLGDWPLSVTFRPVKLPRARRITGPLATAAKDGNEATHISRLQSWRAADLVLVAQQSAKLCGYLVLTMVPGQGI